MPYALLTALLVALVYAPMLWVRWVMRKHSRHLPGMPGTGGELARHLLDRFGMDDYRVETTAPLTDHFDPGAKTVRLSDANHDGRSLTACAIAAHEVGHAIQHHRQESVFKLRSKYLPAARALQKAGIALFMLLPVVGPVFRSPTVIVALIAAGVACQLIGALSYLIVLPEEWDASFNKALPILKEGYLPEQYEAAVRQVLKAAALTYFAAALASIVNVGRWLLILRR